MDRPMPDFHFKLMFLDYKFRDFFSPPGRVLKDAGIKPGFHVLDYGCGPGSYITATAQLVGESGRVYALDIHPLAIQSVQRIASRGHLTHVETIHSDCRTGLPDYSMDVVLLYDTFHDLSDPDGVLKNLHRVLNPGGILSFSDHHMKENEIASMVTGSGLFKLSKKRGRTRTFLRVE